MLLLSCFILSLATTQNCAIPPRPIPQIVPEVSTYTQPQVSEWNDSSLYSKAAAYFNLHLARHEELLLNPSLPKSIKNSLESQFTQLHKAFTSFQSEFDNFKKSIAQIQQKPHQNSTLNTARASSERIFLSMQSISNRLFEIYKQNNLFQNSKNTDPGYQTPPILPPAPEL